MDNQQKTILQVVQLINHEIQLLIKDRGTQYDYACLVNEGQYEAEELYIQAHGTALDMETILATVLANANITPDMIKE